ncbi:MAG: ATP-binding protein [Chlamydiae bacterium]|nr:ATP-binding protein [Chlamydiota bacterium]MBI3267091.1 ATP-binding protein [Chlamydiota bacterium]
MRPFIAREAEIQALRSQIHQKKPTLSIIYGRRRIGKTALIQEALTGQRAYFFEGLENQGKSHQIQNFLSQLFFQTKSQPRPFSGSSPWREVFKELIPVCQEPVTLVFDEFQWMANDRTEIISDLKMVWEQYLSRASAVHLILCGSIASFMIKKVVKSKALFGRSDLIIHLKPFSLNETKLFLTGKSEDEIFLAQMMVGGVPKYLELLKREPSILLGMQNLGFKSNGYFVGEYDRIFVSHFGKNPDYRKIVECLAQSPYGLARSTLSKKTRIQAGGGLSALLYDLETAGFIRSYRPFNKGPKSRHIVYCLSDAYLRFYFSFIEPTLRKIENNLDDLFSRITQTSSFSSWLGRSFEYVCVDHAKKIAEILGFSGIDFTCGPYFELHGKRSQSGIQIDLLFDRADKVLCLCEMKYTASRPGKSVMAETQKKVELIQKRTKKTLQKILITKTRPTEDLLHSGYFYKTILAGELMDSCQ